MRYTLPLLFATFTSSVFAHNLWIDHDGINYTLYQGHLHSAHAGASVIPYNPVIVKKVACLKSKGDFKQISFTRTYPIRFSGKCDAVLISISSGYWVKTPWETKNLPKIGITNVLKSWKSEDVIKRVDRWSAANHNPSGKGLEITPQSNPFKISVNDKITVLVTENGKPMPGVPVAYQGNVRGMTGIDGLISLRIRTSGAQLISTSNETPLADGKADTLIRAATLQFNLPK